MASPLAGSSPGHSFGIVLGQRLLNRTDSYCCSSGNIAGFLWVFLTGLNTGQEVRCGEVRWTGQEDLVTQGLLQVHYLCLATEGTAKASWATGEGLPSTAWKRAEFLFRQVIQLCVGQCAVETAITGEYVLEGVSRGC